MLDELDRLDAVEPLGLEPLSSAVGVGLLGFGTSSLDAEVSAIVTGETHWLVLSLNVGVWSRCCMMLLAPVFLGGLVINGSWVTEEVINHSCGGTGQWWGLDWEGHCRRGTGIWLFVDFNDEGMCLEAWGSAPGLIWGLGFGMWVGFGVSCSWGVGTWKRSCCTG